MALSGEPCEWMCPPEARTVSPPAVPGPRATIATATAGVSATETTAAVARPRTAERVGGAAAIATPRQTAARAPVTSPGIEAQSPRSEASPGSDAAWDTAHPASKSAAIPATACQSFRPTPSGVAASSHPRTMQNPIAASDRTASCLPCASREGSSSACRNAISSRHMVAAERNVASRRLSAVSVSTVLDPFLRSTRREPLAALRGHDFPAEHHVVVLVGQVVAVRDVRAGEGAEPARDVGLLARVQRDHVFLGRVVGVPARRRQLAVAHEHRVLLHVEVHRVDPAATAVLDPPDLAALARVGGVLVHRDQRLVGLELLAVDEPLGLRVAVGAAALKLERRSVLHERLPAGNHRLRLTQLEAG